MSKRSYLTVGINKYNISGNNLQGCVNDALNIKTLLEGRGYVGNTLLDEQASRQSVVTALESAVQSLRIGDTLVYWHSSHGSYVPDRDGDEADGKDEVLCCYDIGDRGFILDDELYSIFQRRAWGTRIIVGTDTCFSGGINRFVGVGDYARVKFLDPDQFLEGAELKRAHQVERATSHQSPRPGAVVLTGCEEGEVSYDAFYDGRYEGAMTHTALQVLHGDDSGRQQPLTTIARLYRGISALLPSAQYPQSPQLFAKSYQRRFTI